MLKRALDIAAAAWGLALLSPVLALVALAVKLTSAGPVLFVQERMGRRFRRFRMYKFRSMAAGAAGPRRLVTAAGDPRVTGLGRILRRTKLDEIPQLFNVLRGDMSLVGPRPEVPGYVAMFRDDYADILQVRPGITDLASIAFRDEEALLARAADPEREYLEHVLPIKIRLAREYLRRQSLRLDLQIIVRTLLAVAGGRFANAVWGDCPLDRESAMKGKACCPPT